MRNLWLISCLFLTVSCSSSHRVQGSTANRWLDTAQVARYRMQIKAEKAEITGILIVKYADDAWRGSLINEFGVKAFDFIAGDGKCRLLNTIPFLDKWYIRRTIASDLAFFIWGEEGKGEGKKRSLQQLPDQTLFLKNGKNIEYRFQSIEE